MLVSSCADSACCPGPLGHESAVLGSLGICSSWATFVFYDLTTGDYRNLPDHKTIQIQTACQFMVGLCCLTESFSSHRHSMFWSFHLCRWFIQSFPPNSWIQTTDESIPAPQPGTWAARAMCVSPWSLSRDRQNARFCTRKESPGLMDLSEKGEFYGSFNRTYDDSPRDFEDILLQTNANLLVYLYYGLTKLVIFRYF